MTWIGDSSPNNQAFTAPQQSSAALVTALSSLSQIMSKTETTLTSVFIALEQINTTLGSVFPQATGTAGGATGGAAVLPANPVGFIDVYVPSLATTVLVPFYAP